MPALGADMEAGTLVEWLKQPGDRVARGDIIAVVDTAKGAIEIEVFEEGVLEKTLVAPGEEVPVGTVLALIANGKPETPSAPARPGRVRASPAARRRAEELGVDLPSVTGTGPDGAVQLADIERAAGGPPAVPVVPLAPPGAAPPAPTDRQAAIRRAIATAMTKSKREIPHYYLATPIDMTAALDWLRTENDRRPVTSRLLPAALLVKAVALALRDQLELNGHWVDDRFHPGSGIHVGCAVSLRGGGLVAPAIHDADAKGLPALMEALLDLTARARAGTLRSSELTDATITVTSLGERGVETVHGIIYPPQVALVGFGRIADRAWAVGGRVEARQVVTATLAADHRASDGHRGGRLLTAIDRLLQEAGRL